MVPGNPCVIIKANAVIPNSTVDEITDQIYLESLRVTWDEVTKGFKVIEKIDDFTDIIYFYIKAPFGVASRDFCEKRAIKRNYP